MPRVELRDVQADDLPVLFEQQRDPVANRMAAFTPKDPSDQEAFTARWARITADEESAARTILADGAVAGSILVWRDPDLDAPEVTYWLGREFWGRGIATAALTQFLQIVNRRPLHGRAAQDNAASIRVLEKCGFTRTGAARGYANARGEEIDEVVFTLA